jgi:hypothetical protein
MLVNSARSGLNVLFWHLHLSFGDRERKHQIFFQIVLTPTDLKSVPQGSERQFGVSDHGEA